MERYTGDWYGLYRGRWGEDIVPDAYAHPAKYARGLIRRIYDHLIERGYVRPGDRVADPFGGVALGALDAMRLGLDWWGNELEEKFVKLGLQNLALWDRKYAPLWPDTWGSATLTMGDSRELGEVLRRRRESLEALGAVVSSPPFNENRSNAIHGQTKGFHSYDENEAKSRMKRDYVLAEHPANIGNLPMVDESLSAVVSSPPFGEGETRDRAPVSPGNVADCITRAYTQDKQGTTPGNLATMETREEGLQAVVSSPPWSGALPTSNKPEQYKGFEHVGSVQHAQNTYGASRYKLHNEFTYMSPEWMEERRRQSERANLGRLPEEAETVQSFWEAARAIVDQCYLILKPGAVAVWVVKRFVRNKQIVDFPDQWRQMCEAAGFETVEWIRAWVVEEHGEQLDLFGNSHARKVERKSFFRRLYESKYPENSIDWEDVLIMRRS